MSMHSPARAATALLEARFPSIFLLATRTAGAELTVLPSASLMLLAGLGSHPGNFLSRRI